MKWMSYNETLFLSYDKVLKMKIVCSYSKEGDPYWLEDSPLMDFKVDVAGRENWEIFKINCLIAK